MSQILQELREIIRKKYLRVGDFTLSSGKKSSYYLDCRTTTLDPRGALLIARLILETIRNKHIKADAIGGLTMGADPIACGRSTTSFNRSYNTYCAYNDAWRCTLPLRANWLAVSISAIALSFPSGIGCAC